MHVLILCIYSTVDICFNYHPFQLLSIRVLLPFMYKGYVVTLSDVNDTEHLFMCFLAYFILICLRGNVLFLMRMTIICLSFHNPGNHIFKFVKNKNNPNVFISLPLWAYDPIFMTCLDITFVYFLVLNCFLCVSKFFAIIWVIINKLLISVIYVYTTLLYKHKTTILEFLSTYIWTVLIKITETSDFMMMKIIPNIKGIELYLFLKSL